MKGNLRFYDGWEVKENRLRVQRLRDHDNQSPTNEGCPGRGIWPKLYKISGN